MELETDLYKKDRDYIGTWNGLYVWFRRLKDNRKQAQLIKTETI